MLALICASLDSNSTAENENPDREHKGTLIIAPKSSKFYIALLDAYRLLTMSQL